jgi:hypothetical protein
MIRKLVDWWRYRRHFVIMDAADSSVTFSRDLFRYIRRKYATETSPKVFVFFIPASGMYGFVINRDIDRPTQLADIQYNAKYRCIGFESLNPAVARIMYDYGLGDISHTCRLSVSRHVDASGKEYFQIEKPVKC